MDNTQQPPVQAQPESPVQQQQTQPKQTPTPPPVVSVPQKKGSKLPLVFGLIALVLIVIIISVGYVALTSYSQKGESSSQVINLDRRSSDANSPDSGFGDVENRSGVESADVPLSSDDTTGTLEQELDGTDLGNFDDDLSDIDAEIGQL